MSAKGMDLTYWEALDIANATRGRAEKKYPQGYRLRIWNAFHANQAAVVAWDEFLEEANLYSLLLIIEGRVPVRVTGPGPLKKGLIVAIPCRDLICIHK